MVEPPRGEPALVETDLDFIDGDSEEAVVSVAPSTVADAIDAAIDAELSLAEAADLEEQERALQNATGAGDGGEGGDGEGEGGGGGGWGATIDPSTTTTRSYRACRQARRDPIRAGRTRAVVASRYR